MTQSGPAIRLSVVKFVASGLPRRVMTSSESHP